MLKKKISTKIAFIIGAVEIVTMVLLFIVTNSNLTGTIEAKSVNDLAVIAKDRALVLETYFQGYSNFMELYSKSTEIRNVLQNPEDKECIAAARELTKRFAEGQDYIEGLYVAQWDTYVLAHNNPDSVDQTFRSPEDAKTLKSQILSHDGAFSLGIVEAPVTKKMVIPFYVAVYDEGGKAIGFVGAAFYTDSISAELSLLDNGESRNMTYSLLNAENGQYIFDDDTAKVGTICEDPNILKAIQYFESPGAVNYTYDFKVGKNVGLCYYIADRNWLFVLTDNGRDVLSLMTTVRTELIITCILFTVLMVAICGAVVDKQMQPMAALNKEIVRLKRNDYTRLHAIDDLLEREDEFGTIANAVDDLHSVLENQYVLFKEMLEAQTVGTFVTRADNEEVIMINRVALEMFGLQNLPQKEVTVAAIRGQFDAEAVAIVDENMEKIKNLQEGTVKYECFIYHGDERICLLTYAKRVILSNNDNVIVFSLTDITERKKVEEELQIQSETDFLTGICNRRSGEFRVNRYLKENRSGLFCLFDINKFKYVNDTYGHNAGDIVLKEISKIMLSTFRATDVSIRLGGDEFVAFAANISDRDIATLVIERFLNNIDKLDIPEIDGHKISISLGAVFTSDEDDFDTLYAKADSLMYQCKKIGGNAYEFFRE
jgi:diguanylate cyclase (GGDEF)-like protein/PAS domain S-box-containing protein